MNDLSYIQNFLAFFVLISFICESNISQTVSLFNNSFGIIFANRFSRHLPPGLQRRLTHEIRRCRFRSSDLHRHRSHRIWRECNGYQNIPAAALGCMGIGDLGIWADDPAWSGIVIRTYHRGIRDTVGWDWSSCL